MKTTLQELVDAATQENWELVDRHKAELPASPENKLWIVNEGLASVNPNIRDLAATLVEQWNEDLTYLPMSRVFELIEQDPHEPVRIHLAAAVHRSGRNSKMIEHLLDKALFSSDPEIRKVAEEAIRSRS